MTRFDDAKRRAFRVPLPDSRHRDRLTTAKTLLAGAAAVGAVVWLWAGAGDPSQGAVRYSPGPLAFVHQTWEAECAACHIPFAPLRDDAWAGIPLASTSAADRLCQSCHRGAEHHPPQLSAELGSCASCHRDHQGRQVDLTRPDDRACTRCHGDLPAHAHAERQRYRAQITGFHLDGGHPNFRSLGDDPRQLKFTHDRHLAVGLKAPTGHDPQWRLENIETRDRDRYRQFVDPATGLIRLQCHACHRSDASESGWTANGRTESFPTPSSGAYMLPIVFERDCRGCHPLSVPYGAAPGDDAQGGSQLLPMPHGLSPREMRALVREQMVQDVREATSLFDPPEVSLREFKPGHDPLPDRIARSDLLAAKMRSVERELAGRCAECHLLTDAGSEGDNWLPPIAPTQIPHVWFAHAKFDHAAHRALSCRDCHAAAYGEGRPSSSEAPTSPPATVMIPDREVCKRCHQPRSKDGAQGGARFDCAECHTYHAGAHLGQELRRPPGRGVALRDAETRRTIEQFLRGAAATPGEQ